MVWNELVPWLMEGPGKEGNAHPSVYKYDQKCTPFRMPLTCQSCVLHAVSISIQMNSCLNATSWFALVSAHHSFYCAGDYTLHLLWVDRVGLQHFCLCLVRLEDRLKLALHTLHEKGLSPLCTSMCLFKWWDCLKPHPHRLHENGFSPVCCNLCVDRCPAWENLAEQMLHEYGLSFVWIRMCFFMSSARDKITEHSLHRLSSAWVFLCFSSSLTEVNIALHVLILHHTTLSSLCRIMCFLRWATWVNVLLQTVHR